MYGAILGRFEAFFAVLTSKVLNIFCVDFLKNLAEFKKKLAVFFNLSKNFKIFLLGWLSKRGSGLDKSMALGVNSWLGEDLALIGHCALHSFVFYVLSGHAWFDWACLWRFDTFDLGTIILIASIPNKDRPT